MSMNYPDAAARARVGRCLLRSGSGQAHFQAVGCDRANMVVTARTERYDDPGICGAGNGYTTWRSNEFPSFSYTMCFRGR